MLHVLYEKPVWGVLNDAGDRGCSLACAGCLGGAFVLEGCRKAARLERSDFDTLSRFQTRNDNTSPNLALFSSHSKRWIQSKQRGSRQGTYNTPMATAGVLESPIFCSALKLTNLSAEGASCRPCTGPISVSSNSTNLKSVRGSNTHGE